MIMLQYGHGRCLFVITVRRSDDRIFLVHRWFRLPIPILNDSQTMISPGEPI